MVAYVADEFGELTGLPLNVALTLAVLVCEPLVAVNGPRTQVTMWLSFAGTATGSVIPLQPALHEETSTALSVMAGESSGTSPVFSTVKR